jgi:cell division protein FtsQ
LIKKKIISFLWIVAGILTVILLGAAMQKKNDQKCSHIKIEIVGSVEHLFVNETDILQLINANGVVNGKAIKDIDIKSIETLIEKNAWIKNAEVFINNNKELVVTIEEKEPIARVFTLQENSFYIDSSANQLPLSNSYSARVPVFTAFPTDKTKLAYADSLLMSDVVKIATFILADSFWNAQIAQVNILPNATFEIIPVIGNQIISIGNANNLDKKFNKLYSFYSNVWLQSGLNKYEKLSVEFDNQIVAVKKGSTIKTDTTKVKQLINVPDTARIKTNDKPKAILKNKTK